MDLNKYVHCGMSYCVVQVIYSNSKVHNLYSKPLDSNTEISAAATTTTATTEEQISITGQHAKGE